MKPERFKFALERLDGAEWALFETLASQFLVGEFPELRTVASPSGDGGRDSELFSPLGDPTVVVQYSVRQDWSTKIRQTARRIQETLTGVLVLVYATNQIIGADGDAAKTKLRKDFGLVLDIRDRSWFVDRVNTSPEREAAAEVLAEAKVDPLLRSKGLLERPSSPLSSAEAQASLVYLQLQWDDVTREKGLTKLALESLVLAALAGSTPEDLRSREEVREFVRRVLASRNVDRVAELVDQTLARLAKKKIRHHQKQDGFCLAHEERIALDARVVAHLVAEKEAEQELVHRAREFIASLIDDPDDDVGFEPEELAKRALRVIERHLWAQGEAFASSARTGDFGQAYTETVWDLLLREFSDNPSDVVALVDSTKTFVGELLVTPGESLLRRLRLLADAYTLMAFLAETADVQRAVKEMFSRGELWLDATVMLPLFAETLVEDPANRRFTNVFEAATESGLSLFVTEGILEELERHMNRCVAYLRHEGAWQGDVPFLYAVYAGTGYSRVGFEVWLETFRGRYRPVDDIATWLEERFGIAVRNLHDVHDDVDDAIAREVTVIWDSVHERRRERRWGFIDPAITAKLIKHDVETYLGILGLRRSDRGGGLGYQHWLVSLDPEAFKVRARLGEALQGRPPDSPVMSPDFLVNYLALGPSRASLDKSSESRLPIFTDIKFANFLPEEILDRAAEIREAADGVPEPLVRRRVRDELDRARRRQGAVVIGGLHGVKDALIDKSG